MVSEDCHMIRVLCAFPYTVKYGETSATDPHTHAHTHRQKKPQCFANYDHHLIIIWFQAELVCIIIVSLHNIFLKIGLLDIC